MKMKKGFTLVELLTVIIIIGLISIIVIGSLINSDKRSREKLYKAKVDTSSQQLIIWAQDQLKCFTSDASGNQDCFIGLNKENTNGEDTCKNYVENNELLECTATFGQLAENGLIKYDEDNKIINPIDKQEMNNETITLYYNKKTHRFSTTEPVYTVTTTKKNLEIASIEYEPDGECIWSKTHEVTVTIYGGTEGLSQNGTVQYGWSTTNYTAPSNLINVPISYENRAQSVSFAINNSNLTGEYYLWIVPSMTTTEGITINRKVSVDTYWFDNTPPAGVQMNFVFGDFSPYTSGTWTNKNLYAARSEANQNPSGGNDDHSGFNKYQISIDNENWIDYDYNWQNEIYHMYTEGVHHRYFRACDKAGNCTSGFDVEGKIDKTNPTVETFTGSTSTITFSFKDDRSGIGSYCIVSQNDSSTCTSWTNYNGGNALETGEITINNPLPGRNIYIFVKDKAGNISDSKTIDTVCQNVRYENGTTCTASCGGGTYNRLAYDSYSGVECPAKNEESGGSACNTMDCCSEVEFENGTTCSKTCGGGTYNRIAYSAYDGSACPAKNEQSGGSACNTMDCCSKVTYEDGESCNVRCGDGTLNRIAYSAYDGSACPAKNESSGGSACNAGDCCGRVEYRDGTTCSKKCGGGTYNRIAYSYYNNSVLCPAKNESSGGSSCNTGSCCSSYRSSAGSWSSWSGCVNGTKTRSRTVSYTSNIDGSSCGSTTEYDRATCYTCAGNNPCSVDGNMCLVASYEGQFGCWVVCWYNGCGSRGCGYPKYYCP